MESKPHKISSLPSAAGRPSKRLLFDRRYGWVVDEWKEPSEEALAGGRGMFCIVPLAQSLLNLASHSINVAATSAVKVAERPDMLVPQNLQDNLKVKLHNFLSSVKKPDCNMFILKNKSA